LTPRGTEGAASPQTRRRCRPRTSPHRPQSDLPNRRSLSGRRCTALLRSPKRRGVCTIACSGKVRAMTTGGDEQQCSCPAANSGGLDAPHGRPQMGISRARHSCRSRRASAPKGSAMSANGVRRSQQRSTSPTRQRPAFGRSDWGLCGEVRGLQRRRVCATPLPPSPRRSMRRPPRQRTGLLRLPVQAARGFSSGHVEVWLTKKTPNFFGDCWLLDFDRVARGQSGTSHPALRRRSRSLPQRRRLLSDQRCSSTSAAAWW